VIGKIKSPENMKSIIENKNTEKRDRTSGTNESEICNNNNLDGQDVVRTSSGRTVNKPSRLLGITHGLDSETKAIEVSKAITGELKQLFEELQALLPVSKDEIPQSIKVLKSHMFVVEKHLACGKFDKVKARLVADGRDQDPELFPNKSSPTVSKQFLALL
jgi:hypothetical protein